MVEQLAASHREGAGTTEAREATDESSGAPGVPTVEGSDEMGTEIADEPRAVEATLAALRGTHPQIAGVLDAERVLLVGTGASLAVARCALPLWLAANRAPGVRARVDAIEAAEFLFGGRAADLAPSGSTLIAISKSGKSPEMLAAAELARAGGAHVIALTAVGDSALAHAAGDVVLTPIGEEHGAATKSELSALAALLAMGRVLPFDEASVAQLVGTLAAAVGDPAGIVREAASLARARRVWVVGFGVSYGIADALALLWHEKARTPAVPSTPSGFRHGLVEAASADDVLVVVDAGDLDPLGRRYMERLQEDCDKVSIRTVWLSSDEHPSGWIRLTATEPAQRVLEALVRAHQLAHETALAAGTYVDGFAVLRAYVQPGAPFA